MDTHHEDRHAAGDRSSRPARSTRSHTPAGAEQALGESALPAGEEHRHRQHPTSTRNGSRTSETESTTSTRGTVRRCDRLESFDPLPARTASNPTVGHTISINGVGTKRVRAGESTQAVANYIGSPAELLFNEPERFIAFGVWNGFLGMISSSLGRKVEREAVETMMEEVAEHAKHGVPLRVIAHSQGAIITSNALEELRKEVSPELWKTIVKNTEVDTYGARNYRWPPGMHVRVNVNEFDIPAAGMGLVSAALSVFRERSRHVDVINLPGWRHNLQPYLERATEAFVKQKSMLPPAKHGPMIAQKLFESIRDGKLAPQEHRRAIMMAVDSDGKHFARPFLKLAEGGQVGKFSTPPSLLGELQLEARSMKQKFLAFFGLDRRTKEIRRQMQA